MKPKQFLLLGAAVVLISLPSIFNFGLPVHPSGPVQPPSAKYQQTLPPATTTSQQDSESPIEDWVHCQSPAAKLVTDVEGHPKLRCYGRRTSLWRILLCAYRR